MRRAAWPLGGVFKIAVRWRGRCRVALKRKDPEETEMLKRGTLFEVIDWDEGQAKLPFDE